MYKEVSKSKVTNTLDALKFILTLMYTWPCGEFALEEATDLLYDRLQNE
jgi:hypothetical protein